MEYGITGRVYEDRRNGTSSSMQYWKDNTSSTEWREL